MPVRSARQGDAAEALPKLEFAAAARALLDRCHAARYVERAEAVEHLAIPPATVDRLTTLTAREREVAALIARGLSNRQIA